MTTSGKSRHYKISEFSVKELLGLIILVLAAAFAIILVANHFIQPAPPHKITLTTGMQGGSFAAIGEAYRRVLAREKIEVELLSSSGAVENLRRLQDSALRVDAGFLQGGTIPRGDAGGVVSLGGICYTPLWVFYRGQETFDDLSQLKGLKINIGPEGSGIRKFSLDLLAAARVSEPATKLLGFANAEAARALVDGSVDAVMVLSTADGDLVQDLLRRPGVRLMSFSLAEAYTRLFPALSHVILPRGVLDLGKRLPPSDVHLLAPTANLVVRDTLHPALMYLLLEAATEIHGSAGLVNRAGEFPTSRGQDFPLSDQAERFYKSGKPFLFEYLPFWAAVFVDRLVRLLVPTAVVLLPLVRVMPWFYSWRNRRKFHYWYGELKTLELEMLADTRGEHVIEYEARLARIESAVNEIHVPLAFFQDAYDLKEHIHLVRERVALLKKESGACSLSLASTEEK